MNTDKNLNNTAELLLAGDKLRIQREKLGLTQQDVADRLCLKPALVEDMENNQFDLHTIPTFTRGYFRAYAKLLELDEEDILSSIDDIAFEHNKDHKMLSFSRKTKMQKNDNHIMRLTWGIFIICLIIPAIWWWQNNQQDTLKPELSTEQMLDTVDDADSSTNDILLSDTNDDRASDINDRETDLSSPSSSSSSSDDFDINETEGDSSNDLTAFSENQASETSSLPDTNEGETEVNTPPAPVESSILAMTFNDDCWIQVKDSSGKVLSTGLKKKGQFLKIKGKLPYSIILGAPEGVSITLADKSIDLSHFTAGKVARLTLP